MRKFFTVFLFAAMLLNVLVVTPVQAESRARGEVEIDDEIHHDTSAPLRSMTASPVTTQNLMDPPQLAYTMPTNRVDPVIQSTAGPLVATTAGLNFAGVGSGDYGFAVTAAPPDTNGAVGDTQYVQWVNSSFAVFNKTTGALVMGPTAGNTIWSGFGGGCQTNNDGDPVVQFDKAAHRWIMTQFSVSTLPYTQCVAVSTTADATGTYNRYAFSFGNTQFNDYPKLGVWPDAYYMSFNIFNGGTTFAGAKVCALDRAKMLTGAAATQQCFQTSTTYGGLLPSDLDGSTPPPAGEPNTFAAFGNNSASLDIWKFHVDFTTPANSTFTGPTNIAVPAFVAACSGGGTCIAQPGTSQQLDSLADRVMYRLAYRNFGDHEALVLNHSVTAGTSVGVRWYELRNIVGTPSLFQSGTYAPDATNRWMGSIAMDKAGNIALGYSASSSTVRPSIRYTGRAPGDALGTLQAETTILTGGGSQLATLSRWGDYSAMTVDPTDDCTFYYTNEYLKSNGTFNWSTQIASFKFPSCNTAPPVLTTITVSPASASVATGGTQQYAATGLDQFGQPVSPQPAFTWSVSGGGSISATGLFTAGATAGGPFTVTATSGSVSGTASVTVTAPPVLTTITVSPASATVATGGTQQFTANGLDQFGQPVSPQPAFTWSVSGGGSISASGLFTAGASAGGPFTVTATSGSVNGTASVTVTASPVLTTITVAPASASVATGGTQQFTATGRDQFGVLISPQPTFTWSVSGGGSISASGLFTAGATAGGPFTVTATSGSVNGTASVTVRAVTSVIQNGTFETGTLASWTPSGTTGVVSTGAHGGTYAARLGSTAPTNGNSSIKQTFTAPAGAPKLTFWYNITCPDTVTFDWATATLRDNTTASTKTILPRTCTNGAGWKQVSATLTAGHSYTLTLTSRDDNFAGDATFTLFDDVIAQ